jgi:succinoglycan biosynthesis protein ExoA
MSRISVVMPVRNEEEHIVAALTSVLAQSQPPAEVLVVDGASEDRTVELVRGLGDRRIRVLPNPSRTIPAALNVGLRHATGDFLARVDAHARINNEYLAIGLSHLADPAVAAVGGIRLAVADSVGGKAIAAALCSPFGVGNSINHYAATPQDTDHASFGIYRAEVARAVGGWDEGLLANEDVDFDHRIQLAGHRIRFDPGMQIHWHVRETIPDFARQYRRYGRGKAGMVRKNGRSAVRVRHLAAPALVGMLAAAGGAAVVGRRTVAGGLLAPYAVALAAASITTKRRPETHPDVTTLRLVSSFATMHITWGWGFWEGLLFQRTPAAATGRDPAPDRTVPSRRFAA